MLTAQPWHDVHPQINQLPSAGEHGYNQPAVHPQANQLLSQPAGPQLPQLPGPWPDAAPLPTLLHPTSTPPHSPCIITKGVTSRFCDYIDGDEFDDSGLSRSYDQCHSCEPALCTPCTLYSEFHATQPLSHMVTLQEKQQHQSGPVHVQYVTSPALAAVTRGCSPHVLVPEAQAPVPSLRHQADSPVPWPSGVPKGATSSIFVPRAQHHVDVPALDTLCTPCTLPSAVLRHPPTYPCIPCNPYPTPTSPYDQQNATQHMIQAASSDENKVFVSDGYSWKEFNLEKIFSW